MKIVEDDKDTSCNGNGVLDDQIKKIKMISSEPPKVSTNGDVHNDDSISNSDSLNGSGDLLIEDPNTIVRNGTDEIPFQNGNKPDDTRSWSSNSSNFPPPDIDEDLSDEMTLRLSDEEDDSENVPGSTENKKDSIQHTSSPLLLADQNTLSDKIQIPKLVEDDLPLDKSSTRDDGQSNTEPTPSDSLINKIDGTNKSLELESLISEIMPDKPIIDTDKNKSVSELREEMEELLNEEDSEKINTETDIKEECISDNELNSSTSTTINCSFSNEDSSSELNKQTETDCALNKEKETTTNNLEKTEGINENAGAIVDENKKINDNSDQLNTEKISDDNSELDKNKEESEMKSSESNKDVPVVVSSENVEKTNVTEKSVSVEEKSDSVSDNISVENKDDKSVTDDDLKKDSENNKILNDNDTETTAVSEPMETESNSEKIVDEVKSSTNANNAMPNDSEAMEIDSEPMEIESKDDEKLINEPSNVKIEETTKTDSSTEINEKKNNDLLVDSKVKEIEVVKSESEGKVDFKEENIKGKNDEESAKSLKRSFEADANEENAKKPKITINKSTGKKEYVPMNYLRDFLSKKEVKTMTREELEELCVQKMCESINQSSKVGDLNRLVKQQEQVIESLRAKYNGLKKQIGDISIVQNKMLQEVRTAKAKDGASVNVMPVKITRSVGLQVSLQPSNRMRVAPPPLSEQLAGASPAVASSAVPSPMPKRRVQRISLPTKLPNAQTPVTPITTAKPVSATIPKAQNAVPPPTPNNKLVKTLLPRTYNGPDTTNKDVSSSTNSLLGNYLTNSSFKPPSSSPNVIRKTMTPTNVVSSTATTTTTANSTKVIDLTDEDDIAKATPTIPPTPAGIRVVAPHQLNSTPTSTPVTSQMQRVTYLVSPGQQGQVLLATTTAQTRPGGPRSTIMFKPVQPGQVPNGQRVNFVRPNAGSGGSVAVVPVTSTASIRPGQQLRYQPSTTTVRPQMISSTRITPPQRHPAPLPGPPAVQPSQPTWKAMPPKPSLKISRVGDGIVLSWKMLNKDMSLYEDIASYQLYAYQETNALPSTDMWRKVGDVKALALPMACTLTQFTDGNKYHFAVRAVDVKSRVGPFSQPEQIALP